MIFPWCSFRSPVLYCIQRIPLSQGGRESKFDEILLLVYLALTIVFSLPRSSTTFNKLRKEFKPSMSVMKTAMPLCVLKDNPSVESVDLV